MSKIMSKTEFIKKHILPYEDAEQQVLWHEGSIGFDDEYLEERATNLNITIMSQDNGSKSSDAYDEERLQEENAELDSKVEWYDYFVDYVYKVNKNLYNDACEYADKEQSDD